MGSAEEQQPAKEALAPQERSAGTILSGRADGLGAHGTRIEHPAAHQDSASPTLKPPR